MNLVAAGILFFRNRPDEPPGVCVHGGYFAKKARGIMALNAAHQYVDRETGRVLDETLFGDAWIKLLYARNLESQTRMFKALTSCRMSRFLAWLNFDLPLFQGPKSARKFARRLGVDLTEARPPAGGFATPRQVFERKIRFAEARPMSPNPKKVVSPADSRFIAGSLESENMLFIKEKFFDFTDLFRPDKTRWLKAFAGGDWAVFRLTPDMYHYNHAPVAGEVRDHYAVSGAYNPCNPAAVMNQVDPFSKNKRVVTVVDTDVPGGTGVGLVAMIEVAALMIGDIVQCYSPEGYDSPVKIRPGLFLEKGSVKSMYRTGGSTDVLVFQKKRVRFSSDLMANLVRKDVNSRFSAKLGRPLVETRVKVRQTIGEAV